MARFSRLIEASVRVRSVNNRGKRSTLLKSARAKIREIDRIARKRNRASFKGSLQREKLQFSKTTLNQVARKVFQRFYSFDFLQFFENENRCFLAMSYEISLQETSS